ncbi:hypothetical protein [Sphingomonas sp. Leaf37]|uniref:hypothetical protein n=1 Tax=Sphingomonas sp. Leaf37 TaxID=2876552 RepID=UPI001E6091CF|nr:hypothetical protein [Sphingomonas sp. Leaf37]
MGGSLSDGGHNVGVQAVANLIGAIGAALITSGQSTAARTMLDMSDAMNAQTIPEGSDLETLQRSTSAQRALMAQMGL